MSLNFVVRYTYLFAWVFALAAVIFRGLERAGIKAIALFPTTSRGFLIFSAFLFIACVATVAYEQAQQSAPPKSHSKAA